MQVRDAAPSVVSVESGSPADLVGILSGDRILSINGIAPRDVLEWRTLTDEAFLELDVLRGGLESTIAIHKRPGELLGVEVSSPVFDRVRTCDNHCPFCFIYQLPKGLRRSLYVKDDDYRLSFLYGNFTTLTRFTESDLERVLDEGLSPLNVSIHATDPVLRSALLRNRRGAVSLRWLKVLLDNGIRVNGQIVVCPGINGGSELSRTLASILEDFPALANLAVVPLGISKFNTESSLRRHSAEEAAEVVSIVEQWQDRFRAILGRRLVFASDEYYLMAGHDFPALEQYDNFDLHEDGVGMARTFALEFQDRLDLHARRENGFFQEVDAAPAHGYRAVRNPACDTGLRSVTNTTTEKSTVVHLRKADSGAPRAMPIGILTGEYGAAVIEPLIRELHRSDVRVVSVPNSFFGGNISVTGLMVGSDIARVLQREPRGHRYLLPDVCLSEGRFLDGTTLEDLPQEVEVVPTDGHSLRAALEVHQ